MSYGLYLFDFDYTLANSEAGIVMCFQHVLKNNGFGAIDDLTIKRTIGLTLEEAFMALTGEKDKAVLAEYRRQYVKKSDEVMTKNTFLYPETASLLEKLKAAGAAVGIISTKYAYRIEVTLREYGIDSLVDLVIGGEMVSRAKPDPEGVLKAMDYFKADSAQVLYTGDSLVDAKTAAAAGVDFAAVTTGTTTAADFSAYPCVCVAEALDAIGLL
ncbi:MAG: HAD family hydrolase [Eubacterium sp.]|nr:HAD family hydrolase [Eubacterium sp.]